MAGRGKARYGEVGNDKAAQGHFFKGAIMIQSMPINRKEIKRRRVALGLTLQAASERAGWKAAQQWKKIEDQKLDLRVSTLERIAKALRCGVSELLVRSG